MSEINKPDTISRRSAFSLFGKAAAFAIAACATSLAPSDAEAQTAGMTQRQAAYWTARAARRTAHWAHRSTEGAAYRHTCRDYRNR